MHCSTVHLRQSFLQEGLQESLLSFCQLTIITAFQSIPEDVLQNLKKVVECFTYREMATKGKKLANHQRTFTTTASYIWIKWAT